MTKKELRWRLKELPDACDIAELVKEKVITAEEARNMLFKNEESTKVEQLEEEVKFLREMVDKLTDSKNWTTITKIYKEYEPTYPYWYKRYAPIITNTPYTYCSSATSQLNGAIGSGVITTATTGSNFSSLN